MDIKEEIYKTKNKEFKTEKILPQENNLEKLTEL